MGYFFHFSSLYPTTNIELYMCLLIQILYLNFKAILAFPKTASSAQIHRSISFIWIVWSTLYLYLWLYRQPSATYTKTGWWYDFKLFKLWFSLTVDFFEQNFLFFDNYAFGLSYTRPKTKRTFLDL